MTTIDRDANDDGEPMATRVNVLLVEYVAQRKVTMSDAIDEAQEALDQRRAVHESGQPLSERDEARAQSVAKGNVEGFSSDPEAIPDAFREPER